MIRGCLILLTFTIIAIVWHNIDQESLRGALRLETVHPEQSRRMNSLLRTGSATKQSPSPPPSPLRGEGQGEGEVATPPHLSAGRNDLLSLFPEQRFLISGPIDINSATIEELEAIPRIGSSLAKRIIEFRNTHGRLESLEELLEVKGIGPRILESIKPYLKTPSPPAGEGGLPADALVAGGEGE